MAKIKFIGDIHVGKRPSHSSKASAHRHKLKVDAAAEVAKGKEDCIKIQVGDLFDSYSVSNNDLSRAVKLVEGVNAVLKGNHDHAHNSYNVSAVEDLKGFTCARVITEPYVLRATGDNSRIHFIPYMPTQELFLKELDDLKPVTGKVNILVLHTNMYGAGLSASEVENNLTEDRATALCKQFDLVVSGHEHNGSVKHGVHMVGSLFPYSFGDISSKYALVFDTDTKTVTKELVWNAGTGYDSVSPEEFLKIKLSTKLDFIEIIGDVPSTGILPLVKHMSRLLSGSTVSSIKNNVKVLRNQEASESELKVQDWEAFVRGQLTEEQFALFQNIKGALK